MYKGQIEKNVGGGKKAALAKVVATIVTGVLMGGTAFADQPPANEVYIKSLSALGSGCKPGTTDALLSADQQAVTLFFSDFIAAAGPREEISNQYKTCNIQLDLHHPRGWQYAIIAVDYRGYAALDSGVQGTLRTQYWQQGVSSRPVQFSRTLFGPHANEYLVQDVIAESQLIYSPCADKRALNLKASVAVRAIGNKTGLLTVDSIDGEVKHTYRLKWRRCSTAVRL